MKDCTKNNEPIREMENTIKKMIIDSTKENTSWLKSVFGDNEKAPKR